MGSELTWLDQDENARKKALRILELFEERESRDELGLGTIRDSFADQLFPGTSTIQTRLRYMLFVPWIFGNLEERRVPAKNFKREAERCERELIQPLSRSDASGVFGRTSGERLKRLPSSVYWAGLGTWGIRRTPYSLSEYYRRIDETYRARSNATTRERGRQDWGDDADRESSLLLQTWHPRLPSPPPDFPVFADFRLTRKEAEFIRDRIEASCPGSLLALLALRDSRADVELPWEHPDYASFPERDQQLLNHARLFSEAMNGAALLYNLLLARLRQHSELVATYEQELKYWQEGLALDEIREWSLDRFWDLAMNSNHGIGLATRRFVENWITLLRVSPTRLLADDYASRLIQEREMRLKGSRSRFQNRRALEQWGGSSGVGRMVYRWPNTKILLNDLYDGLNREFAC